MVKSWCFPQLQLFQILHGSYHFLSCHLSQMRKKSGRIWQKNRRQKSGRSHLHPAGAGEVLATVRVTGTESVAVLCQLIARATGISRTRCSAVVTVCLQKDVEQTWKFVVIDCD